MTDFDYGLGNHIIRITSDRSDCVVLWFWPQMTAIRDRVIAAAKQDMWEARREPRGQVFCGERQENGVVLADDREKLPVTSPLHRTAALDRRDRERGAALRREAAVPPSPAAPLARPVRASPPQQPKPATSTLLPKMPLPPHLQRKGGDSILVSLCH
jgi:hypothetical protein